MNTNYKVTIEEMISQDCKVEANTIEEALAIAEQGYKNGIFVLSPGKLVCKQIYPTGNAGTYMNQWMDVTNTFSVSDAQRHYKNPYFEICEVFDEDAFMEAFMNI